MASKFLRALAAVKLVELDEQEQAAARAEPDPRMDMAEVDRILAEEEEREKREAQKQPGPAPRAPAPVARPPAAAAPRAAAPPAPAAAPPADGAIAEGVPFDDIYAKAGVPQGPYPAEKLLKLLDGLRAMDAATRRAAVMAMDAADEQWAIADVVLDAQRKLRVLGQTSEALEAQLVALRDEAAKQKQMREDYLKQASETIRAKIAELEEKLQTETAEIAGQKAAIDQQVLAAEGAFRREAQRIAAEAQRLGEIPSTFAVERAPQRARE